MTRRRRLVAGNWKLHGTRARSAELAGAVRAGVEAGPDDVDVVVGPSFPALAAVADVLRGGRVGLAAQDVHWEPEGAFTGEVSVAQLADVGCTHCIVGHSERRAMFGDTDERVARKRAALLAGGLVPIVCIGETLAQREAGETEPVCLAQLAGSLEGLAAADAARVVLAYEPVWAIGTGRTAEPSDAQAVHAALRAALRDRFGADVAEAVRILYGGSVKPSNAAALFAEPDVDGALVGGASLDAEGFLAIVRA